MFEQRTQPKKIKMIIKIMSYGYPHFQREFRGFQFKLDNFVWMESLCPREIGVYEIRSEKNRMYNWAHSVLLSESPNHCNRHKALWNLGLCVLALPEKLGVAHEELQSSA